MDEKTTSVGAEASEAKDGKKKFLTKDVVMCVVVLVGIALVAGVLLGLMNWVTYVDPDAAIKEQIASYYGLTSADEVIALPEQATEGDSYVSAAYAADTPDGRVYVYHAVGSGAKSGTLELLVHIRADGEIAEIEVYSQSETANYFNRVMTANKGKYVGKNAYDIIAFDLVNGAGAVVDDGDVDAVSQATLTSRGVNNAVNAALASFVANVKEAAHE